MMLSRLVQHTCRLSNNIRASRSLIWSGNSGCSTKITFRDFGSVNSELEGINGNVSLCVRSMNSLMENGPQTILQFQLH
jgi:hypothetical protein